MRAVRSLRTSCPKGSRGFTLVELLVVITIIGILIALLLPAVQMAREAARRSQCTNNLKQLALAMVNYHQSKTLFPYGYSESSPPLSHERECWMQQLLPYIEQQAMFENYAAAKAQWIMDVPSAIQDSPLVVLMCPSDGGPAFGGSGPRTGGGKGGFQGNYVVCTGDRVMDNTSTSPAVMRGIFHFKSNTAVPDIRDGTSNTLMFGEVVCRPPHTPGTWGDGGAYWGGARYGAYGFTTLEAPNTPVSDEVFSCKNTNTPQALCTSIGDNGTARVFARSRHPGGVNVAFADGAVRFITNTIALATWRAIGTRDQNEVFDPF